MVPKTQTIEVDASTAEALRARSAELGISVAELLAELAAAESGVSVDAVPGELAELERRARRADEVGTVDNNKVVRWLETWGTSRFEPWRNA
jgi:hypothetical protein